MTVVAAARNWWAAHRRRSREPSLPAVRDGNAKPARTRLTSFLPMLVAGAMVLCAAIGFAATEISEHRLEAEQHAALQHALDEFRAEFGNVDAV